MEYASPVGSARVDKWIVPATLVIMQNTDISRHNPILYYDTYTLAEHLGLSWETLKKWRQTGYGPPWIKIGQLVRYNVAEAEAWLAAQVPPPKPRRRRKGGVK